MVKNKEINNGETFRGKLLKFITDDELAKIENNLPALTIFVPTLPNFNPEIWSPVNEIPAVAVANVNEINSVNLYLGEKEFHFKSNEIPGFPTLVVKQNERVVIKTNLKKQVSTLSAQQSDQDFSFEFIDDAFDGSKKETKNNVSVMRSAPAPGNPNAIDQVNIDAYNSGVEWHRDYVYYGLTPTNTTGKLKNNYSEFITSFKFLNGNDLFVISDQTGDPHVRKFGDKIVLVNGSPWMEGRFEFRITILVNSKNGIGNEITKVLNVDGNELFHINYTKIFLGYRYDGVTPKEYHPNIELLPWDLENYGTAWKFIFYEIDPAQEITNSFENTSTFASNFEISVPAADKMKVGLKFGASATFVEKRTYSVKTTLNSDFLGEATLSFDQPIIIGTLGSNYITREITTGNVLSIGVEPKMVF